MRAMLLAASAAALSLGCAAQAQDQEFYVGVFAGVDFPDDEAIDGFNAFGAPRDINVELDAGPVFGLTLGFAAPDQAWGRVRGEVETSFREAEVDVFTLNDVDRALEERSEVSVAAAMINLYYDTPVLADRFRVYGGVGFGLAGVDNEILYLVENPNAISGNARIAIPSTETTYAYQLIAGGEVQLGANWSLVGDVRYFDVGDFEVQRFIRNSIIDGVATNNGTIDSILDADYSTVSLTAGLRYRF